MFKFHNCNALHHTQIHTLNHEVVCMTLTLFTKIQWEENNRREMNGMTKNTLMPTGIFRLSAITRFSHVFL